MARYLTVGVLATLFACTKSSISDTEVAVTPGSGERPGVAPAAPEPAREPVKSLFLCESLTSEHGFVVHAAAA